MLSSTKYIDVILPLPVDGVYTYSTESDGLLLGQRVVVQFGPRKLYTAVVKSIHDKNSIDYKVKPVLAVLDEDPIINVAQLRFWDWFSNYYMCSLGDVMNAALPTSFKLASESKVIIDSNFDGDLNDLSVKEVSLLNVLTEHEELTVNDLSKLLDIRNTFGLINELVRKQIVYVKENLHDKYKEKYRQIVNFTSSKKGIKNIKLTSKQEAFVIAYLELLKEEPDKKWVVSDLLNELGFSRAVFNALISKEIFSIQKQQFSRLSNYTKKLIEKKELAAFQRKALQDIKSSFRFRNVCLLHGVTSSGKTELYIKLIEEQMNVGKQVLYLVPEIALTTQIIKRLQEHFGSKVGVMHSHLNNSERVEVWRAVQEKDKSKRQYPVMLGARSSLFLPFDNLGLIIIDEEHDASFKQHQPAPRYHARDAAIYLANIHQAKVLLGSATPCLETYYNTKKNKYSLVEMHTRFGEVALPKIEIVDIRKAHLKKEMVYQFAPNMLNVIKETLNIGKQVILFQNRRGYSPFLSCNICAYTPVCKQCDVSLTHHKWNNQLKCHYCGYRHKIPCTCPNCNSQDFSDKGFGTEQIEESLKELFPKHISKRMDYDTTRSKNAHQKIITEFEKGNIDILVGTQMVTKGLDFDNVALVGVLNADSMMHFPDFRSYERAFQLMMQVAGRAGRKGAQGRVLIQTYDHENEIFNLLKANDFKGFIIRQAQERKLFGYPPFNRIIGITLKHRNQRKLDDAASQLSNIMRKSFGNRVLGPEYPAVSRIRNFFHKNLLLKIEHESSMHEAKNILRDTIEKIKYSSNFKGIRFVLDVDPI